jgi:hypothetical protein
LSCVGFVGIFAYHTGLFLSSWIPKSASDLGLVWSSYRQNPTLWLSGC